MPTQADIARALKLSQATVSLALRGDRTIPEETCARVHKTARELGYRADPLISALMAQRRTKGEVALKAKIGLLTDFEGKNDWKANSYTAGCFKGAMAAAAKRGYLCEHVWAKEPGVDERRLTQILHTQNFHGLIVAPWSEGHPPPKLDWSRFGLVALDYSWPEPELHRVVDDHSHGMDRIFQEIDRREYRRPGLILRQTQNIRTHHSRLGAFLALCTYHPHWKPVKPLIFEGDSWSTPAFTEWLSREKPDVVLTEEHRIIEIADEQGIKVPKDLGIVFFHKEQPLPQWSGLTLDYETVGATAAAVLTRLIETNERGPTTTPTTTLVKAFSWQDGATLRRPVRKN